MRPGAFLKRAGGICACTDYVKRDIYGDRVRVVLCGEAEGAEDREKGCRMLSCSWLASFECCIAVDSGIWLYGHWDSIGDCQAGYVQGNYLTWLHTCTCDIRASLGLGQVCGLALETTLNQPLES